MKKHIGIWIDFRQADIITLLGDDDKHELIASEIDEFKPKGGSHSDQPWGAVETVSEKTYLERRRRQEGEFFQQIAEKLTDAAGIYVFGPAEAKLGLTKYIKTKPQLAERLLMVDSADSMTLNQKIACVKSFFADYLK